MEFRTTHISDDAAVISPVGRLTMVAAGEFKALLEQTLATGRHLVVVDLDETTFLDSSGLGALVTGLRSARTLGGDLRIARPGNQPLTVLELTTMDRVLRPHPTVEDALRGPL